MPRFSKWGGMVGAADDRYYVHQFEYLGTV